MRFASIRSLVLAFALLAAAAAPVLTPAFAQGAATGGGTTQNAVQGPASGSNPTASAVSEDQLFRQLDKLSGRVSIPDAKAALLQQPQGRDYRGFREGLLPWIGGIVVLGMILALAVFYFTKGRISLEHSEESGRKILRFNALERFTHWLTKPPPRLSQFASVRSGMLSRTHTTIMMSRPSMNGQARKLWAYLAYCDQAAKASGPMIGISSRLPKM